jgi:hypothetical protein
LLASVGAAAVVAYHWADRLFRNNLAANYEFKRVHVSNGRVLSVSPIEPGKESGKNTEDLPHLKICFSIDSFSDIPRNLREEYETAEKVRIVKEGPRCIIPHQKLRDTDLKPGDPIEVDYLLYGKGVAIPSRIVVQGQDLD